MLTSARGAIFLTNTKDTQISGTSLQGSRRGEEEHTHIEGPCRGGADTSQKHVRGEGGSGEIKKRRNGGRVMGGRGKMGRSRVGGKGGRMI